MRIPAWNRLDRAVMSDVRGPLWLGFAGFSLVLLLNYVFRLVRQTIERRLPIGVILGFAGAELPRIFMFSVPMAVLLAILVGVGRLATQNELVALRSAGISPARVFRPVLGLAVLLAAFALLCSHVLMPAGRLNERQLVREVLRIQDVNREIDPGVFFDRLPGAVLYARRAGESPQGRVFEGILLHRESPDGRTTDLLLAKRGRAVFDPNSGRRTLLLDEGEWHIFRTLSPDSYSVVHFEHYTLPFPPEPAFAAVNAGSEEDPSEIRGFALRRLCARLRQDVRAAKTEGDRTSLEARLRNASLEWHRRWSLPLASVVLAFAGFPLAARSRRGGKFSGLAQALTIIFVFWLVLSTGWGLSEQGKAPAWLGPWAPNILVALWAAWLWRGVSRSERGPRLWASVAATLAAVRRLLRPLWGREETAAHEVHAGAAAVSRRGFPGRLDSFLAAGYLRMFFAFLFVLLVLALVVVFKGALDDVDPRAARFPWGPILTYMGLSIPSQLRFTVPIASLFGAAVCLSGLARSGEIVALKAAGIGPVRIALPLLATTCAFALGYGAVQEAFMPVAERESQRALDRIRGRASEPGLLETGRRWLVGDDKRIWNYLDWDANRQTLLSPEVFVADLDAARLLDRIEAQDARRTASGWLFLNGWERTFNAEGLHQFEVVGQKVVPFSESAELFGATRRRFLFGKALADQMTIAELSKHLRRMARAGYDPAPLIVGLHEKLATPLLPLVLVLVGIPVAVSGWQRKGSLYGFGVAILVVFAFWASWAVTTSLGRQGVLSPVLAAWLPPVAVAATGVWLLVRAR